MRRTGGRRGTTGVGTPGGACCSSLVRLNRPTPGTDTRLGQHHQATWPCAHPWPREQSPEQLGRAGEPHISQEARPRMGRGVGSVPKVTGQRGPRSWEATGLMAGGWGSNRGGG